MKCKAKQAASEEPPPSSSMDSCGVDEAPAAMISTATSCYQPPFRISTDLHLGLSLRSSSLSIHTTHSSCPSTPSALTTTAATADIPVYELRDGGGHGRQSMFVKVYMEGVPIGRKLDLLLLDGYDGLLDLLARMFKASTIHPGDVGGDHQAAVLGEKQGGHVLTYQDQEGDWLVAGDVPWELFLESVKKLRIAWADSCFH